MSDKNQDPGVPASAAPTDRELLSRTRERLAASYDILRKTAGLTPKGKAASPGEDNGRP